jgi:hypothetical protein
VKRGYVDTGEVDIDTTPKFAYSTSFREPGAAHVGHQP